MTRRSFGLGMSGVAATILLGTVTTEESTMAQTPPDPKPPKDPEPDRRPYEEPN